MMKEHFINFMREKGFEPTEKDINRLLWIASECNPMKEKLDRVFYISYNSASEEAKKIHAILNGYE